MFPSSHDITPFNLKEYVRVAKLILAKGNRLLIVTKPCLECVNVLLEELELWRDQILLRFTIGSMVFSVCDFWEPGAPEPVERLACLRAAYMAGYKTSVSIEPMLEGGAAALDVILACRDYVTDDIWIGKMNKVRLRVDMTDRGVAAAVRQIERLQSDNEIITLYRRLAGTPMIQWKDSIKDVLARNDIAVE